MTMRRIDEDYSTNTTHHGYRIDGYGGNNKYDKYHSMNNHNLAALQYPLWYANDFRSQSGGIMHAKADGSPTGFHFHNFFMSSQVIHNKYFTFGHAMEDAIEKPIWDLCFDLAVAVECAQDNWTNVISFNDIAGSVKPIYYLNEDTRRMRDVALAWRKIVQDEEKQWNSKIN